MISIPHSLLVIIVFAIICAVYYICLLQKSNRTLMTELEARGCEIQMLGNDCKQYLMKIVALERKIMALSNMLMPNQSVKRTSESGVVVSINDYRRNS